MDATPDQIRKHIEILSDFEQKYGDYLVARHNRQIEGRPDWSSREWAERERELRMLAPRAEVAIEASGVERYAELSSVILAFKDWVGFTVDARDDDLQREILRLIPSQLTGLHMRLEEAEARVKGPRLLPNAPLPRLFSRIANLPPWLGFAADLITVVGFAVVALGAIGHFAGLW
jgi:hypothetical protein